MDAVMARRRRSPVHASDGEHRRRRRSSSSAPLDSLPDDMLEAILLRLPRQPSSRPRASAVSRRLRGIVTNPVFHRRFHAHHRKPPLLGVFERRRKFVFTPVLGAPDRIPAERLSISRWMTSQSCDVTACRHGRVLAIHRLLAHLVVFAPLTGQEHCLSVPSEFRPPSCFYLNASVLCADSGKDHMHGFCHKSPFKVALLSRYPTQYQFITSVYSSETRTWNGLFSMDAPFEAALADVSATLVGNMLYWMLSSKNVCCAMLEFDLDRQRLAVIKGPSDMIDSGSHRIIKTEQGTVGWVRFSFPRLQIWQRNDSCEGQQVTTWLLHKTVDMHHILGIPPRVRKKVWNEKLLGYDEENNVIILYVDKSAYMVDLKSMQSTKLDGSRLMKYCHPFTSFYPADMAI